MNSEKIISLRDVLLEFIEVATHNILFYRKIYPENIFVLKQKYGICVYSSSFPQLNYYITESLKTISELLETKHLNQVCIVFFDNKSHPIEQFVFNILKLESDVLLEQLLETSDPYFIKIQESMRAFCLKLSMCDISLKPLPQGVTFQILVHTTESAIVSSNSRVSNQSFPWIELEEKEFQLHYSEIVPIRGVQSDLLHLEIYAEQCPTKFSR